MKLIKALPIAILSLSVAACNRSDKTELPPVAEVVQSEEKEVKPVEVAPADLALAELSKIDKSHIVRPVYLRGINEIYLHETAQDKLKHIFGASVVIQELADFYHYGYGTFYSSKAENQSDEEYNALKSEYLKKLLPGTITTANQAKRLSEQVTNDLYGTLTTQVDLNVRTLQALKQDSNYREHFAETVKTYEIKDLNSLVKSMDDIYRFLSESGVKISSESSQSQEEILKLITSHRDDNYGSNLFSVLRSDLFGFTTDDEAKTKQSEKLTNFLRNEALGLILGVKKNISIYWNAHTYLRAQMKMKSDESYKVKLQEVAEKYGVPVENITESLAIAMPLFMDRKLDFKEEYISYNYLIEESKYDTKEEALGRKAFKLQFENLEKVSGMGKDFARFFSEEARPLLLATYSDDPCFLSAYPHYVRVQKELDEINRSAEWMTGRIPNETDMKSVDIEELKKSITDKQDLVLIDAKHVTMLCQSIIKEAIEASLSVHSMASQNPAEDEYLARHKPSEREVIRKMEAKLQLNQLGFNMELLNTFSKGMADYYDLAKTPEANAQIKKWGEEIENYNRYMTEKTGNKPGDKNYSGPWEDEGVLPLAVKMAKKIGLSEYEIEAELSKGRALAVSLEPGHIGYSYPLDFRADGGSGVSVRP